MKYTRNKINQAGKEITNPNGDIMKHAEAVMLVDNWRKDHLPVLEDLFKQVSALLESSKIAVAFASQRLKRMVSIIGKLKRNPDMGLGGVQDIGGARFVFNNIPELMLAKECLSNTKLANFSIERSPYDYVENPKESGYRSIHFVYKYSSDIEELDGMRVELQIRTKLQHDWATAVETAELVSKSPLKSGNGDAAWLDFFKLVSAIFASTENCPLGKNYEGTSQEIFCRKYGEFEKKYGFLRQLQFLVGVVKIASSNKSFKGGYVLVLTEYANNTVQLKHFAANDKEAANALYAQVEPDVSRDNRGAAVLVSVSDISELMDAYPSYFLNAKEFIQALTTFSENCKLKGWD